MGHLIPGIIPAMDELAERWRHRFPILAKKNYLINNSLGAMPASVPHALQEYTDLWAEEGVVAWDTWLPMVADTASVLEDIIHAPRGSMTMTQNTTNSLAEVLSCLDYEGAQNRIVHCADAEPWTFGAGALMRNLAKRGLI